MKLISGKDDVDMAALWFKFVNQFEFYFPLFQIMIMNLSQSKVKIKLVKNKIYCQKHNCLICIATALIWRKYLAGKKKKKTPVIED